MTDTRLNDRYFIQWRSQMLQLHCYYTTSITQFLCFDYSALESNIKYCTILIRIYIVKFSIYYNILGKKQVKRKNFNFLQNKNIRV